MKKRQINRLSQIIMTALCILSVCVVPAAAADWQSMVTAGGTAYTVQNDIGYVQDGLPQQAFDVYLPSGAAPESGWPVIVLVPGGGFQVCPRGLDPNDPMGSYGNSYKLGALDHGFAVISVGYRAPVDLTGAAENGGIPAEQAADRTTVAMTMADDVKAALRYITLHAAELGVDSGKMTLMGESAGGGLATYLAYGQPDTAGYQIQAVVGIAPANHDVWTDQDWSRSAASADAGDPPYYIATGTHDFVCTAERALGIANLLLSRKVNVTLEFMPDAVHMDQNLDNNFYARAVELGRESRVWQWVQSVLDGRAPAAPESYQLTYDDACKPAVEEKKMVGLEPLVVSGTQGQQSAAATYEVQRGDSLWKIAASQLGSGARWRELYELNRAQIKDPSMIFAGQILALPQ